MSGVDVRRSRSSRISQPFSQRVRLELLGTRHLPTLISAWRFPRKSVRSDIENSFGADQVIRPEQSFTNITPKGRTVLQGHVYFLVGHDQLSRT